MPAPVRSSFMLALPRYAFAVSRVVVPPTSEFHPVVFISALGFGRRFVVASSTQNTARETDGDACAVPSCPVRGCSQIGPNQEPSVVPISITTLLMRSVPLLPDCGRQYNESRLPPANDVMLNVRLTRDTAAVAMKLPEETSADPVELSARVSWWSSVHAASPAASFASNETVTVIPLLNGAGNGLFVPSFHFSLCVSLAHTPSNANPKLKSLSATRLLVDPPDAIHPVALLRSVGL